MDSGTVDKIVERIEAIPDCTILGEVQAELTAMLASSIAELQDQLADLATLTNPATFIANFIIVLGKSTAALTAKLNLILDAQTRITTAINDKITELGCP